MPEYKAKLYLMIDELDFETYLSISPKKIGIYLLDKKKLKNLYFKEQDLENNNVFFDFYILKKFLDNNIFKIEKLLGKFIKNISLIIQDSKSNNIYFGVKKESKNPANANNKNISCL